LQGRVYLAQDNTQQYPWVVVKETWRDLVKKGKSRSGHKVPENFEREKEIQLYLSNLKEQNEGYVRCIESWEDENCCYLAMEYCGAGELFNFIRDKHKKGDASEKIVLQEQKCQQTSTEWSLCVQSMFSQLVNTVSWMHSNKTCHLDLSLENTMIISIEKDYQVKLKIIDFGLARRFEPNQTFNEKVGKIGYMAPEVYGTKEYLPEMADIWSLGVMLFMMLVGAPPYDSPNPTAPAFRFMMSGRLRDILIHWKRLHLVSAEAFDVMEKIFKPEKERITMKELRQHPYVGLPDLASPSPSTKGQSNVRYEEINEPTKVKANNENSDIIDEDHVLSSMKSSKAQEMGQMLKHLDKTPENIRQWIQKIQQHIEKLENSSSVVTLDENPKTEQVMDDKHNNDLCISELKQLLEFAKDTLNRMNAT